MPKHTHYVKGMHCASCEILIEKELLEISGTTFADASLSRGLVNIEYSGEKLSVDKLNKIFKKSGYIFSDQPFKEESKKGFLGSFGIALLIIGVFFVITKLGLASFANINYKSSLPAFFIFGLIAGVSSCAALIGGLVLSFSKQWIKDYGKGSGLLEKAKPHFLFNFGRIISFSLLGALLGLLGEKFKISPSITSVLVLFVSAIMLLLALQMLGVRALNRFRVSLPKKFYSRLVGGEQTNSKFAPFVIGFLTFLLPCGFTVVAEGAAVLSGSPEKGLMIMLLFVLGTMLPLLAIGFSSTKFLSNQNLSEKFLKVAGVLIIFFVAYNLNYQFGLAKYISDSWQSKTPINDSSSKTEAPADNVQLIKTIYTPAADIQPSTFEVKKGQQVRFEVEVRDNGSGCMSTIMIPGLWNRPLSLVKGETLAMEFTPSRAGSYQITCAMGVPRGTLKVTD